MASVTLIDELGKIDGLGNGAESWPSWTDRWIWEPTDVDADDWSEYCEATRAELEADLDEDAAFHAAAMDLIERSLIPDDIALMIDRTRLASDPDAILHAGSDQRWCLCEACLWDRTARYSD